MRKNTSLFKLAIVIAFAFLTAIAVADPYVCGDADNSGAIDIDDVVYLIAYIFSGGPAPDPSCCGSASDCPSTVTDYDGNIYFVAQIGSQCWMGANLKVTRYRNGDPIPNMPDPLFWSVVEEGYYCDWGNNPLNGEVYGRLYNWYAVDDSRNIAPEGWHVATDADWKQLELYLGMDSAEVDIVGWRGTDEGGKVKEAGTAHWNPPNTGATNESGFTAWAGGYRDQSGNFTELRNYGDFWCPDAASATTAYYRGLGYASSQVSRKTYNIHAGFSVRCVKD